MQSNNSSDFTVRIRFRIPSGGRIGIDEPEVMIAPSAAQTVILKSADKDTPISQADWLVVQCSGWGSASAAEAAVDALMDALRRALASCNLAADFGRRAPQGGFVKAGLQLLEGISGRPTLNDAHGPMVFATELRPLLARGGPLHAHQTVRGDRWKKKFVAALENDTRLSERERTAFDLYSAAHESSVSEDAKFVLLFASIEALLEDSPRPTPVVAHVDQLLELTIGADLEDAEKDSLLGSLRWLRSHSIRSCGRCLIHEKLGDRMYGGKSAETLFLECYDLRNRLLHGRQPFPTREEVSRSSGPLDQLVGNLLAGPILER
jgi:hypothetical protein